MRIIPAIDIIDGKCVRLSKGDYDTKKIYNENPVEVAKEFEDFGIQYLHLVDLDGAKAKKIINQKVIENISEIDNFYFVHSYYAEVGESTTSVCDYITSFSATLEKDNFYAAQFHPEKSGDAGFKLLENFLNVRF